MNNPNSPRPGICYNAGTPQARSADYCDDCKPQVRQPSSPVPAIAVLAILFAVIAGAMAISVLMVRHRELEAEAR